MSRRNNLSYILTAFMTLLFLVLSSTFALSAGPVEDSQPTWSPDGKKIAFVSNRQLPENAPQGSSNIWIIDADGTNMQQITVQGTNKFPSWSPDGKKIIFQSGRTIWVVDLATRHFTMLAGGDRGWFAPDWHPKDPGKVVCSYQTQVSDDNDLEIINPLTILSRNSDTKSVRDRYGSDDMPRWSRDGKCIAFIGRSTGGPMLDNNVYLMTINADGTDLKTHCSLGKMTGRPSWSYSGDSILLDGGIVCNLNNDKLSVLFNEVTIEPDFSPDGRLVAYCQITDDNNQLIFVQKKEGGDKKQLTPNPPPPSLASPTSGLVFK